MTAGMDGVLSAALELAGRGIPVFPCDASKAPACAGGFKAATRDSARLKKLWRRYTGPLIGVPTGAQSGLDALDIDPRHGGGRWLESERHRLPITREHSTRAGVHLLFRHRDGVRNSAGRIAPGVDVRATGGYVIWWPAAGFPVENGETVAPWPGWLLEMLTPPPQPRPVAAPALSGRGYAIAALRRAVEAVARAAPGTRNESLNREAFVLCRFASSGELDSPLIANALATAALASGLSEREVRSTLASAFTARGLRT
jgi:Bifunctional DNA primase/polymerase, N-terminal